MIPTQLQTIFDAWAKETPGEFTQKQWMLSKWEVVEGIEWSPAKIELMLKTIRTRLKLSASDVLVDLGCGGGWILHALQKDVKKAYGLDFSKQMLRHAKSIVKHPNLICAEMGRLPFGDESLKKILCYFVFINLTDDRYMKRSISEIVRVLKKGGRALIGQVPLDNKNKAYDRAKASYLGFCQTTYKMERSIRDVHTPPINLYNLSDLKEILKQHRVRFQILRSFNPFYHPGQPKCVDWRVDIVLQK